MADALKILKNAERCRNLLSHALYVNAGLPPGEEAVDEDGNYWCGKTETTYGPDDQLCDGENCRNPLRSCYEAP